MLTISELNTLAESAPAYDSRVKIHDGYVDEKACGSCHRDQAEAFKGSHHANAMAVADATTVRGDFNDVSYEHDGIVTTFHRRDGRFFVRTEGSDGAEAEFQVRYTFAYEPLQQYLVETGGGRLQALDVAWDTTKKEWFWLGNHPPPKPGSTFHWTGPFYRWNRTCIDCHSTDPKAGFQPEHNGYQSTFVATSIGCQSCHGPGATHVAWAESTQGNASGKTGGPGLSKVDADVCLACHSRRTRLRDGYEPGKPFLDFFSPALLRSDLYFPDGQILDEVFEYGSFQQSKMAAAGVTCLDCHRPHDAGLKAEGNAICTQCHTQIKPDRFAKEDPSGLFDHPSHTHHAVGSNGAQCANCHMPERVYMKVDPRRDHSFVIPRPDLSERLGTPNACTTCHAGRSNAWASKTMDDWYGTLWRERLSMAHAFASTANDPQSMVKALRALLDDRDQPGIVRGSAIVRLTQMSGTNEAGAVRKASADPNPLVRLGAAEAAANLPADQRLQAIGALLGDETRAVRVAAANALATTPFSLLDYRREAFRKAVSDLRSYVDANADFAEVQSNYGFFLVGQQRPGDAEAAFQRAISLDPTLSGSHVNLAEFYRVTGQNDKSVATYAQAIMVSPERADLRYGHALSLVRQKDLQGAIAELEEAVRLEPTQSRYKITLAVALDSAGKTEDALKRLGEWTSVSPDFDATELGLRYSLKLRRLTEALEFAEQMAQQRPDDREVLAMLEQLRKAAYPK
ncbi:hypothetical protein JNB88_17710 [Rhizobium cauense]|uniref:tetratricopeptide repeat protein n=1 Tax=Rhizobium cauense TaxID=1166683 RepID=UPI001C6EC345|nr:tetratricopeptide repeat protein [Rhizobium cauense]MBW9115483.1 hypothetical protein [Rhizobium cauense]